MSDFIRRLHDRMYESTEEGQSNSAGSSAYVAETDNSNSGNGLRNGRNVDEHRINYVRHRTVSAINETFHFLEQRLDALQNDVDDAVALKEEVDDLREFREWAEPQLEELELFRQNAKKVLDNVEDHDDDICLLQDRTEEVMSLKDNIEDFQRFQVATETELSNVAKFQKQTRKKLKVLHNRGKQVRNAIEAGGGVASPIGKGLKKSGITDPVFTMENIDTPTK